jgi:hypothetical protein
MMLGQPVALTTPAHSPGGWGAEGEGGGGVTVGHSEAEDIVGCGRPTEGHFKLL